MNPIDVILIILTIIAIAGLVYAIWERTHPKKS